MADTTVPSPPAFAPEVLAAQALVKQAGIVQANVLATPLAEAREKSHTYQAFLADPAPEVGEVVEHTLHHLQVPVTVRLHYPTASRTAALPAYLHIHGGGFVQGDIDSLDRWKREITLDAGIVTVGIGYALSPEAPYPVALEQVLGALKWLRDEASSLGLDPERISVGGESAGGNLALAALIRLRDADDAFVKAGIIIYGMLSADHDTPSHKTLGDGRFGLSTERLEWFWSRYVEQPEQLRDPGVAPLYADVTGLPPLLLQAAALDPLLDDTLNLARKLEARGEPATVKIYPGVPHSFIGMTRILPQANEAREDVIAFLRQHQLA